MVTLVASQAEEEVRANCVSPCARLRSVRPDPMPRGCWHRALGLLSLQDHELSRPLFFINHPVSGILL